MDQARERQASGSAPGRGGGDSSADAGSSDATRAAAAQAAAAQAAAAHAAAAQQAICRILRGDLSGPAMLDADAVALAWEAHSGIAGSAAELKQLILVGAESALGGEDTASVLMGAASFCFAQGGAARVTAAGLLPHVVALLRSPEPRVARGAVTLCLGAAGDAAAKAALVQSRDAVPALLALLRDAPAPRRWEDASATTAATAAYLLGALALPENRATAAAAEAALRASGSPAGTRASEVTAAVLASGGVERMVALLRAALAGGGGQRQGVLGAGRLLGTLVVFATSHPAAVAAARAAGALPLAARAFVAAQRTPGSAAKAALCEAMACTGALLAADDLPALAAQPDLIAALAGAIALAAGGASEGVAPWKADQLGDCASVCVSQLLAGGRGDAAANGFLAAGGAANLVRRRARARVGQGACSTACMRVARARCRAFGSPTAGMACARAHRLAPTHREHSFFAPPVAQVRLLTSLGPCSRVCEPVLLAIRTLAALPAGRRALLAAGAEAAVVGAAVAAAVPPTTRGAGGAAAAAAAAAAGGARRGGARIAGAIHENACAALGALMSPPGARLRESPALTAGTVSLAPPECEACGAAAPPGGGPLQKCTGCGGPERWCSKDCQRASWKAGHREVCKARRGGGG
jgi:trimeric autotransporter adhesin